MAVRVISGDEIREAVVAAIGKIYCSVDPEVVSALTRAYALETYELARDMLEAMLRNAELAPKLPLPVCQDTGSAVVFARIGTRVLIEGGDLVTILSSALAEAWDRFYLRRSIVADPLFDRSPISGTVPPVLHLEQVHGDSLELELMLKGGGAENAGALRMFNPTASLEEVEGFVADTAVAAGGKACPPVIVGVGIGGNFERCALLAKQSLLLPLGSCRGDDRLQDMSRRILRQINERGKGVQGMGGRTTALAVNIISESCHIASLPVAVNLECHAHRHARILI
jgi:fumarate hydratase subunit alpha